MISSAPSVLCNVNEIKFIFIFYVMSTCKLIVSYVDICGVAIFVGGLTM